VETMNDLSGAFELLSTRLNALEDRVHSLEHPEEAVATRFVTQTAPTRAVNLEQKSVEQTGTVFPVLGRAMLGIAGAYVLRAIAESSSLPKLAIAAVAIAYATAWLVWAARSKGAITLARVIYSAASALILAPMLWELTLHFNVISPAVAASVLGAYVITASLLNLLGDVAPVVWVSHGTAALTALALAVATHSMPAFLATLLLIVLLNELTILKQRSAPLRPFVAAVADTAIWALIFVYSGPTSARAQYPTLATVILLLPATLLFLVNSATVATRTALLQRRISIFEVLQTTIAFFLAVSSILFFAPHSGLLILGVVSLVLAASCYAAVFLRFREIADSRNFHIFGIWSLFLLLAGALWCLPPSLAAMCMGIAALASIVIGTQLECRMLEFHGLVFLAAAAAASQLPQYTFHALAGSVPTKPGLSIFVVSASAVLCYAAGKERTGEAWQQQILHLVPAFIAACAVSALLVQGLLGLAALAISLDVFHVAFIRTLTVCALSLSLAFGGSCYRRLEMSRIAYAALAFVAAKLFFEDLRHGRMEFIAASIFLVALTLIAVPRLVRMGHKTEAALRQAHHEEPVLK
jgi:hypothetical protein